MRDIKFRGKALSTGEWVHGNLIGNDVIVGEIVEWDDEYFYTEFWLKVDPESVGQITGLKDKNGKEIYEGDIISSFKQVGAVKWINSGWRVKWDDYESYLLQVVQNGEIIGNIYQNGDLLSIENS